ncbi:hypothetical protein [Bradyrhizobium sp.]|uniref:hypothetical protein n=1 Tax=Bradyrhizobium sp. TaxID=376 RepID=UPI0027309CF1|nr:hypothetical protein [Bradyrhizobium sp.]MDP1866643.1 hypothetical protein [Bradyrhizobium sp.]MDP3076172.1 hypothetical protein [Bradyrhizobium sp.]
MYPECDRGGGTSGIWVGVLVGLSVLAAVFLAIGVPRLPLPAVLLVAIALSIAITLVMRRRIGA